jgi:hypothetical protein
MMYDEQRTRSPMFERNNTKRARTAQRHSATRLPEDVERVVNQLRAIIQKYRGAVLYADGPGVRAMRRALRQFGGKDAEFIGYLTIPHNETDCEGARLTRPGRFTSTVAEELWWGDRT